MIINPLLDQLGFMPVRQKRTAAPKLELPDDIISLIKDTENFLIQVIAAINRDAIKSERRSKKATKIDKSEARYMIEEALYEIGQQRGDKRFTRKNIDELLGYNSKTMYNQSLIYETFLKDEGTIEYELYTDLRGELASLTAQI